MTRAFAAPRELVWNAWADPKHIKAWWGPNGFTTTTLEAEIQPGGVWRFIMHGPDGTDYPNKIVYTEIVKPERLVYDHGGDGDVDDAQFQVMVSFVEHSNMPRLDTRMLFLSVEECEKTKPSMRSKAEIKHWIASTDIWPAWFRVREFSDCWGEPIDLALGSFTQPPNNL